jgi:hypothetical protein
VEPENFRLRGTDEGAATPAVAVPEGVLWRRVGDEVVLLRLRDETYSSFAGVGGEIWELLASGRSEHEIIAWIMRRYQVDAAVVSEDVRQFVAYLAALDLVVREPGAGGGS